MPMKSAPEGVRAVDVPPRVEGEDRRRDRPQHVFVEPREVGARRLGAHQRVAREHQPVGEGPADGRDGDDLGERDHHLVGRLDGVRRRAHLVRRRREDPGGGEQRQQAVEPQGAHRRPQRAVAAHDEGRGERREPEQGGEGRARAAGGVREHRPRHEVQRDGDRGQELQARGVGAADLQRVAERHRVDRDDDPEQQARRGAVEGVRLGEVHRDGAAEDHRTDGDPGRGQVEKSLPELRVGVPDDREGLGVNRPYGHRAAPERVRTSRCRRG
jgi:hypothetical protein